MERYRLIAAGVAAAFFACGGAGPAPALAGEDKAAAAPDGGIGSVDDLNQGANDWHYIAPHAAPGAPPAGSVTDVAKVAPAPARQAAPPAAAEQEIGDHLSVEAPPPAAPATAKQPLWYMPQGH